MERVASLYERQIKNSWLHKDLKLYKNMPDFLASNPRIFKEYPALVNNVMRDVFTVNGDGAVPMMKKIMRSAVETGTPFIFFRDTVNAANPNKHAGMIYASNLCHEIAQNVGFTNLAEEIINEDGTISTKQIQATWLHVT